MILLESPNVLGELSGDSARLLVSPMSITLSGARFGPIDHLEHVQIPYACFDRFITVSLVEKMADTVRAIVGPVASKYDPNVRVAIPVHDPSNALNHAIVNRRHPDLARRI